jgi:hypothetical protein
VPPTAAAKGVDIGDAGIGCVDIGGEDGAGVAGAALGEATGEAGATLVTAACCAAGGGAGAAGAGGAACDVSVAGGFLISSNGVRASVVVVVLEVWAATWTGAAGACAGAWLAAIGRNEGN